MNRQTILLTILFLFISKFGVTQNYNIGELTLELTDSLRNNRPVITEIWYPTMEKESTHNRITELPFVLEPTIRNAAFIDEKHPLIVISHGTGGNRFSLAWLAIFLAKHGYIVAAPDHWGNTFDNKIPEYFVRYWERPQDMSFMITKILEDDKLAGLINKDKIGSLGFSFGGYTSLALAGFEIDCSLLKNNTKTKQGKKEFTIHELRGLLKLIDKLSCDSVSNLQLKDDRIKAFAAFAPALGLGLNSANQTEKIQAPVLIIGAANDQVAPVLSNAMNYNKLISSSKYIELPGETGHYIFLNVGDKQLQRVAKKYYRDDKSVDRSKIHDEINKIVLEFIKTNL